MDTYEKKYNEALERARKIHDEILNNELLGFPEQIREIFPELRESEDERIRKWIIEELEITRDATSGKNPYSDDPDIVARLKRLDEAIDYLEKQKEQKSLNISAASEWLRKHVCTYMNSEYNEFHKCVEYDGSIDKERFINDFEEAMRKEQKPNFYEKDSTDFEIEVHEIIAQARNDSRLNDADVLKQFEEEAAFALMLKANKLIEQQKPAEWSEEDDWKRKELIQYLEEKGDYRTVWMTWLKSLRPQPKQEWSEEDKERYISCLKRLGTDNPAQPETINSKWFKEHVSFRPSWKPSEEDKQCLDTAIELLGNLGYDGEADNLKQLKKQI